MSKHPDYTILIVEDEPDILSLIQEHFTEEGYQTLTAAAGTEAITQAKTKHPDIILLDVMMPGMSGFDVCNILRDFPETRTTYRELAELSDEQLEAPDQIELTPRQLQSPELTDDETRPHACPSSTPAATKTSTAHPR